MVLEKGEVNFKNGYLQKELSRLRYDKQRHVNTLGKLEG